MNSTAAPAADLCAAVEAHAINVTALSALDPATTTVDQLKVAAADVRSTMFPLLVALRASGTLNSWVEGVESGGFLGLVDAIERLPASATAADVTEALAPFGWPEPLISDQRALLADLQEAACTS